MPKCPNCKLEAFSAFSVADLNRRISECVFHYYQCPGCRLIFLSPVPADLGRYYRDDYYARGSSIERLARSVEPELYKIDTVTRHVSPGRLLEIGAGNGCFAYLAKRAGFEVKAIEMDAESCRFISEQVGVAAVNSDDVASFLRREQETAVEPPYDVVAAWHVIEHLPNPLQVMRAAEARLAPGGILVVAMPNPASMQFRIFRGAWAHVDAPRHLMLVPLELLRSWAVDLGLEVEQLTTADQGSLDCNRMSWEASLRNVAILSGVSAQTVLRFQPRAGSALTRIFRPVERHGFLGSAYTVVLRKPTSKSGRVASLDAGHAQRDALCAGCRATNRVARSERSLASSLSIAAGATGTALADRQGMAFALKAKMASLCIVHLVRFSNGVAPLARFLTSYRAHPAEVPHEMVIIFKGFQSEIVPAEYGSVLAGLDYRPLFVDEGGFDIGPYIAAARKMDFRHFCFVNSFSVILHAGWLRMLVDGAKQAGVGIAGATGSWQSMSSFHARERRIRQERLFSANQTIEQRLTELYCVAQDCRRELIHKIHFPPFPAYHIRTNAFLVAGELMRGLRIPTISSKSAAYRFESGRRGFTSRILRAGLRPLVVGKNGLCYEKEEWHASNTFWQGDQENLLVADNQTERYQKGDLQCRLSLSRSAWGEKAKPLAR